MSEKRKILVVATSRKTRGGITAVVKSHEKGEQWGNYQIRWIETHIDRSFPLKLFYFFRALMQYFFLLPFYDLVHIHVATTVSLYRKVLFFVGAKIWRKKIIMHLHSCVQDVLWFKSNRFLYRYLFSHSDCVLVLSSQWKQWVYEALQVKDNVKILYNPVVVDVDEHFLSKIEKKKQILFAGSIIERKGYKDLIQAFSLIANQFPGWNLVFAGNGEIETAKDLAKHLGVLSQIRFVGWVSGDDKKILFAESLIFCLSSSFEGFPMAVLDAWAYRLPVVCTPVGGLPDVLKDHENALVYPVGDVNALAESLKELMTDEKLREKISSASSLLVDDIFGLEKICKQLSSLYEDILS